ncbi:3-dehydroquinate dehydratase [Pyrococcus kukulkanii]|uniref:3-dehydroquinate dehydratase n=1 Tax=Pyrococcus kukulkanii TaxID=1609559 RepID=UPI003565E1A7
MIAGVVVAKSIKEAVRKMTSSDADLYELRVDALEDYSDIDLLRPFSSKLIITIRSRDEGGIRELNDEERLFLFEKFLEIKPAYVDIELRSRILEDVIELAKSSSRVIISYHDFSRTPPFEELLPILHSAEDHEPDVVKIVTYARTPWDNLRVIKLYEHANNLIAFCMGQEGKISRVFSAMFSPFTYASIDESVAPGQMSISELREILRILGG